MTGARARRGVRVLLATTVLAVTAALAAPASAVPSVSAAGVDRGLPGGWAVGSGPTGPVLTWTSPRPLPVGDARLEVRAGDRLLGLGVLSTDGREVSVTVQPSDLEQLLGGAITPSVWAAGRRLDSEGTAKRSGDDQALGSIGAAAGKPLASDPGRPGPYRTVTGEYALAGVTIPGLPEKVEMAAVVVAPRAVKGPRPLVLFLHGRHSTCYLPGYEDASADWPCPSGWKQIPSYRGYLQTQRLLASQGYLTVSISANGINGQDWVFADGGAAARSLLVRKHLRLWARWSASPAAHRAAPAAVAAAPRADLSDVVLVGHSRGGDGANRAALDSTTGRRVPWTIRGVVHIAPTSFGQNPAPGVPVVVLLPYCDGDVYDLQGQAYLDATRDSGADQAFRSAVLVMGANHNFFNYEWTPGVAQAPAWDDWWEEGDKVCGTASPTRLTAAQQRAVGATYTAAGVALFAENRTAVLPLLDGRGARAASAGSARVLAHALGGRRTPLLIPRRATALSSSGSVKTRVCRTVEVVRRARMCQPDADWGSTPHFLPVVGVPNEPTRFAAEVSWTAARGVARIPTGARRDLSRASALDLRVAVTPGRSVSRFGVRLVDAAGHRVVLRDSTVSGLPRTRTVFAGKTWAQAVRLSLTAARGSRVDLGRIVRLDVLPRSSSGRIWLLDGWAWRDGLSRAAPYRLPRVDVGSRRVVEGDHDRTVRIPITVTGPAVGPGRLWVTVTDPQTWAPTSFTVTVRPGTRRLWVPVQVSGDDRDDYEETFYQVAVKPRWGLVAGDWVGGVTVLDDDPPPVLTATPDVAEATEGSDLTWQLTLSTPSDVWVSLFLAPVAPGSDLPPEITSADVRRRWFTDAGYPVPDPPVPLSETGLWTYVSFDAGQTTATVTIPTKAHRTVTGDQSVVLAVPPEDLPVEDLVLPPGFRLVGVVHGR